jgi:anthranilate phosphoribosyltransferase
MNLGSTLEAIIRREELSVEQAEWLMTLLVNGEATAAQAGGILIALRAKGVTAKELSTFAEVLRAHAVRLEHGFDDLVDIVGTGGGSPSFNISTGSSIVAAAAGARVAKHGNRAVTSSCGSADVLEALGVNVYVSSDRLGKVLEDCGIVFFLAPSHHPALRHIAPARRELGVRTVFNQLGPLVNPAGSVRQLIGVYEMDLLRPMADALNLMGAKRAMVVMGEDGLDEISPVAGTRFAKVFGGRVSEGVLTPADFGLTSLSPEAVLPGTSVDGNAAILREALTHVDSPRAQALLPSAGAALWLAGKVDSLSEGAAAARAAIASGAANAKLHQLVEATQAQ